MNKPYQYHHYPYSFHYWLSHKGSLSARLHIYNAFAAGDNVQNNVLGILDTIQITSWTKSVVYRALHRY